MPLSRLPRHAAVAFVAAAALSAPPAARAADAVYGGTTKDGDPIVVTTDKAGLALRSLAMTWRAACSDGSGLTEAYQLTPVMPTPSFLPGNSDLLVSRNGNGRFSGTQLASADFGPMTGAIVVTIDGKIKAGQAHGTLSIDVKLIDPATNAVTDTCKLGKRSWSAMRAPGTIYGGVTSQGEPVVLRVNPQRRKVQDLVITWRAPCTPDGYFRVSDYLANWPVKSTGAFGGPLTQDFPIDGGGKRHVDYTVAGRVAKAAAKGSIQVKLADADAAGTPGSACDTGAVTWKARTG